MAEAKYPISNDRMAELLEKYPFLKHRYFWKLEPDDVYTTVEENLEHNYYKYWDGTGWEDIWKNRYLPRLFKEYDSWDDDTKKKFYFSQVKEKYGTLRIYTSFSSDNDLETIAEWFSEYTCAECGKEPHTKDGKRVIWTTRGWITNLCEDCARKYIEKGYDEDFIDENADINETLKSMMHVKEKPFGYIRFGKPHDRTVLFRETDDNWMEIDKVLEGDK